MNQIEIEAAIAEQEEHVKRSRSCNGEIGRAHAFRPFGRSGPTIRASRMTWSACIVCGVTETSEDYARKIAGR